MKMDAEKGTTLLLPRGVGGLCSTRCTCGVTALLGWGRPTWLDSHRWMWLSSACTTPLFLGCISPMP